ncbi:MAG: zinc carboxypeptidase, partial [Saprospiraceae bacterium]|nr:zinc carboxypeptidase [Saprospiraceae bacterium]
FAIHLTPTPLWAQKHPLTYYLPDIPYDAAIPTPEAFLGYQVGEWHISHDLLVAYMKVLDAASPRLTLTEYARTHENRPLLHLTITSEKNHGRVDEIKTQHRRLNDPAQSASLDITNMPAILYQGFSIHGNEPSGGNAAVLVAYYLAAGQSPEVLKLLEETVIIFDPCFNPDGFNRFASWANVHKNKNMTPDPQDREYNEAWPGGRTNHYWFDLNRDWLPAIHPESQGRLKLFHEWKPNVLTDHHEMGTNATYFFMPGEPQRVNALTPQRNQDFTSKFAEYHAEALDKIGSLYYTREGFDDFFIGKGSTYPDVNGCVGILFEQASSRGHIQQSENGLLTFPFTIRNQVTTALSTQKASVELRLDLLNFQRDFYKTALDESRADSRRAFVFGDPHDEARTGMFVELLRRHQIEVYRLGSSINAGGQRFEPQNSFVVPLEQSQYRLIRGIFETNTAFKDSLFYDISSWTLPLAYNIPFAAVDRKTAAGNLLGAKADAPEARVQALSKSDYAYLFEWDNYFAPRALNYLLQQGLRAKVSSDAFVSDGRNFSRATILIPAKGQDKDPQTVFQLMEKAASMSGIMIHSAKTGLTPEGSDLGSSRFRPLHLPKVMLVIGDGV